MAEPTRAGGRAIHPGRPGSRSQAGEFESAQVWAARRQHDETDHHELYARLFEPATLVWDKTAVLDVGAGPLSIFEEFAPPHVDITPYDTLAEGYNVLIPQKKFPIVAAIPGRTFDLVTFLNCLDHMDAPEELLGFVAPFLAPNGRVWIYCNIDQPYDPVLHPQDFTSLDLIRLVGRHFTIERCGLVREGRLFPYGWWAIAGPRGNHAPSFLRTARHAIRCGATYGRFHGTRALIKAVKLAGFRRWLPPDLQF